MCSCTYVELFVLKKGGPRLRCVLAVGQDRRRKLCQHISAHAEQVETSVFAHLQQSTVHQLRDVMRACRGSDVHLVRQLSATHLTACSQHPQQPQTRRLTQRAIDPG